MPKRARSKSAGPSKKKKAKKGGVMAMPFTMGRIIPGVVPRQMRVIMMYSETGAYASIVGADQDYFRMNSIFDPNETGVGYQPTGHDQWALFYSRYRVLRAKVQTDFINLHTTAPVTVGAAMVVEAPASTNVNQICNLPGSKSIFLAPFPGPNKGRITFPWTSGKNIIGDADYDVEEEYAAAFGANPARIWRYAYTINSTVVTTNAVLARNTFWFDVLMYQPITLGTS